MPDLTINYLPKAIAIPAVVGDSIVSESGGALSVAGLLNVFGDLSLHGATSGTLALRAPAAAGTSLITFPVGTTNFTATGGAGQVLRQSSAGGPITVGVVAASEIGGLGTGVAAFLATPTSANLAAAVTGETGTGPLVFGTGPIITDGTLAGITTLPGGGQINATGLLSLGVSSPSAWLDFGASLSLPSWTTTGPGIRGRGATYTDTTSAAAATVANRVGNSFGGPTFASSNPITVSHASTIYISGGPTAGANTTITKGWSIYAALGDAYFGGGISIKNNRSAPADLNIGGVTAATARSYNSMTDASNGEWAYLGDWAANVARYGTDMNGTGLARDVSMLRGGVEQVRYGSTGATFTAAIIQKPAASVTPANNGELMVQATSNTALAFKLKGTDGTVRTGTITLA